MKNKIIRLLAVLWVKGKTPVLNLVIIIALVMGGLWLLQRFWHPH